MLDLFGKLLAHRISPDPASDPLRVSWNMPFRDLIGRRDKSMAKALITMVSTLSASRFIRIYILPARFLPDSMDGEEDPRHRHLSNATLAKYSVLEKTVVR